LINDQMCSNACRESGRDRVTYAPKWSQGFQIMPGMQPGHQLG
jgi:hypothetical protein